MGRVVTNYVSDHTIWMTEQMAKHPEWADEQKVGRAIWWDRPQAVDALTRAAASNVQPKAYPYDNNFEF